MRTIWLASYPKSGNTWMRMLIANLSANSGVPADINDLREHGGIASARGPFDYFTLIDSGLLTFDEIDNLRPSVYGELARGGDDEYNTAHEFQDGTPNVRFVKCHDAYTLTPDGEPLLAGPRGAAGAIVIVRDPRDVASSLANHIHSSIDDAITFMNDCDAVFSGSVDRQSSQLRQRLPGWSGHIESWLNQKDIPIHLVRYEDIKADALAAFRRALAFAQVDANAADIENAVRLAGFTGLQAQESDRGFRESPRSAKGGKFFRRGEAGAWRDELSDEQVMRIEHAHAPMMLRVGYALSAKAALRRADLGEVA